MKELLKQYIDLKAEVKDLENRIRKLEQEELRIERDMVRGSSPEFPYIQRNIKLEGYNIQDIDKRNHRINQSKTLLEQRCEKCKDMKLQIEKFISTIPDSRTRRVFQYRYIDGLSWQAIAMRIGKVHESYPRRDIHDKYLEGLEDER